MKICRVMKRKNGYGWAKDNRPLASTHSANQCVLAVALDDSTGIYGGLRKLGISADPAYIESIRRLDNNEGNRNDVNNVCQIGAIVDVKVIIGGHGR